MRFYFSQSRNHFFFYLLLSILYGLNGCAPQPPIPSPGHLNNHPFVPPPLPTPPLEVFTVVVDGVPVDKLLFALARDAGLNVDIHPGINGVVTLNAINQTLPQLLERIAKQVDLRYQNDGTLLTISQICPGIAQAKSLLLHKLRVPVVVSIKRVQVEEQVVTLKEKVIIRLLQLLISQTIVFGKDLKTILWLF